MSVLWIVHRLIWGITRAGKPNPWSPLILVGFATVLFGIADLAAWVGDQSLWLRLVAILLTIASAGGAWLLASWWFPRDECPWWALLPGAVIVGLGVGVLHLFTITYVAHVVSRKSSLYGAIGIAVACSSGPTSRVGCSPPPSPPTHRYGGAGAPVRPRLRGHLPRMIPLRRKDLDDAGASI